ncbi:MAG: UDP-N-acetylmuramoyl-tripeptide--D-alanyl-D-alanine ligase [Enterobacteriaceae bacterium]
MINISLSTIALILNSKLIGKDCVISDIYIDSRENFLNKKCMFVALKGKKFDGHDFICQAVEKGASALLINRIFKLNVPQILVANTYESLYKLTLWIRNNLNTRIIAITGSTGKTSIKEMISSILKRCGKVIFTYKNNNNIVGVILTILKIERKHKFAVIEVGASKIGEISKCIKLIKPHVSLVNNIFESHLSGFKSLTILSIEKGRIFSKMNKNAKAIINLDSNNFNHWKKYLYKKKVYTFSLFYSKKSNFFSSKINTDKNGTYFNFHDRNKHIYKIWIPLMGLHNVSNAIATIVIAVSLGIKKNKIKSGLRNLSKIPGRLYPIKIKNKVLLIDDTYNSNIGSLQSAINFLNNIKCYKILVIGDMLDLGKNSLNLHIKIGKELKKTKIDFIFSIGSLSYFISLYSKKKKHFFNKSEIIDCLIKKILSNKKMLILVKGSRKTKMEKIIKLIKKKINVKKLY